MEKKIYIKLLEEGTLVYRPVNAIMLKENIYRIKNDDNYNQEDETWEFVPGMNVIVENRKLDDDIVLVAISQSY